MLFYLVYIFFLCFHRLFIVIRSEDVALTTWLAHFQNSRLVEQLTVEFHTYMVMSEVTEVLFRIGQSYIWEASTGASYVLQHERATTIYENKWKKKCLLWPVSFKQMMYGIVSVFHMIDDSHSFLLNLYTVFREKIKIPKFLHFKPFN